MLPRGVVRFLSSREARSRTPSERAGQKSDPDARRGGLAARAPLRQDFSGQADLAPASLPKSLPVRLRFDQPFPSKSDARKREVEIKGWRREKKEALWQSAVNVLASSG